MSAPGTVEMSAADFACLQRLRAYYPYRLAWYAVKGTNTAVGVSKDRREINRRIRDGWTVHIVKGGAA